MITTVLIGLGTGYFLWGSRVARLTEALNTITLEYDALREKLASPAAAEGQEGPVKVADELHVINESIAAFRQELATQKALIEAQAAAAVPVDVATANAELRNVRAELAGCIADKQDLALRCPGGAVAPSAAPAYAAPAFQAPTYRPPTAPAAPAAPAAPPTPSPRSFGNNLNDPRF